MLLLTCWMLLTASSNIVFNISLLAMRRKLLKTSQTCSVTYYQMMEIFGDILDKIMLRLTET